MQVNFSDQLALRGMRWTRNHVWGIIVVTGTDGRRCGIVG